MNPDSCQHEQLSALLDDALEDDKARFLLRRLQHDEALAATLGRWQLIAESLRGERPMPASPRFVERLQVRLASEATPLPQVSEAAAMPTHAARPASMPARPLSQPRWRWFGGGALAASLAFASLWLLPRPGQEGDMHTVAAAATASATPPPVAQAQAAAVPALPEAGAVALAEPAVPAPDADSRKVQTERPRSPRLARASTARQPAKASASAQMATSAAVATAQAGQDPFRQPEAAPAWPRARIPGSGSSTFNASLERSISPYDPFSPPQKVTE